MKGKSAYFFTYWDDLPNGIGFDLFGDAHLFWLIGIVVTIICLTILYQHLHTSGHRRMDRITGWILVTLILVRTCYLLILSKQTVFDLPLHLCSLAGFLSLLHAYRKWEWLDQTIYSICLPGTVFALVFPDWTRYPAIHFISIEGFLFHAGIVLYAVCQITSRSIIPSLRKIWKAFLFLAIAAFGVWLFDKKIGTNYMFLNWPPAGSPLEWMAARIGNPGYLAGYAVLVVLIPIAMDLVYRLFFDPQAHHTNKDT